MKIDRSTDFGARAARRLAEEQVGWLTTVRADGMPQPVPVWFHWDGETLLIFSEPAARKVRNLAGNPRASLHFNTDGDGDDVVVVTGEARTGTEMPPPEQLAAYAEKYAEGMKQQNLTPEAMLATYSTVIYLTPARVTGH